MPLGTLAHQYRMRMWNPDGDSGGGEGEGDPATNDTKTYTQEDIDNLQKALDAERKQRSDIEKTHKLTAKELKDLKDASKPELERITGERDELQTKYQQSQSALRNLRAKAVVTDAARDAKARSANAVYALAVDQLEYDDDGNPTNVADVIASIQKSDPDLFGEIVQGKGDGGAGTDSNEGSDMNAILRKMAGRA